MMSQDVLLTGTRWTVLSVLAERGESTASDLAAAVKTSLPNVSQATKLLEAYGYISVSKKKLTGPGKPTLLYKLKKPFAQLTMCCEGYAGVIPVPVDEWHLFIMNILRLSVHKDKSYITKFFCEHEELFELCQAAAYIRTKDDEIHLLIISPAVDRIRKDYASATIKRHGETRKIVTWSHTYPEAVEGLKRKESYFIELFSRPEILVDAEHIIERIVEDAHEKST